MLNACTIDVEDYYHVSAFDRVIARSEWDSRQSRVSESTRRILDILGDRKIRATFFVLGWVAERYPELVRKIHEAGHEIGCHSYGHHLVYEMSPREFREDLIRSKDILEQSIAERICSFRAPSFSITHRSTWALEILAEEGFECDSSIFPVHHDRYGIPSAPIGPYVICTSSGNLTELPPTVDRLCGLNIPVAGGGYFRLYPYWLTRRWVNRINRHGRPVNLYVHPWEFDPDQPRVGGVSLSSRFRHYVNLGSTSWKFSRLLEEIPFGSMTEVLAGIDLGDLPKLEFSGIHEGPLAC